MKLRLHANANHMELRKKKLSDFLCPMQLAVSISCTVCVVPNFVVFLSYTDSTRWPWTVMLLVEMLRTFPLNKKVEKKKTLSSGLLTSWQTWDPFELFFSSPIMSPDHFLPLFANHACHYCQFDDGSAVQQLVWPSAGIMCVCLCQYDEPPRWHEIHSLSALKSQSFSDCPSNLAEMLLVVLKT